MAWGDGTASHVVHGLRLPFDLVRPGWPVDRILAEGVVVVEAEGGGNGHLLLGQGSWAPAESGLDLGVLEVATEAYLVHPEHAALGIAAGRYRLRRQREQTPGGTIDLVAD